MRRNLAAMLVVGAASAGCGAHETKHGASTSRSTGNASAAATTPRCQALRAADVTGVGAVKPARTESLAVNPGVPVNCSVLFLDGSGGLIVQFTQAPGGERGLRRARSAAAATARVQPVHRLDGFLAGHTVAFLHRGELFTLVGGYSATGEPQLTASQLTRLAEIAASRS